MRLLWKKTLAITLADHDQKLTVVIDGTLGSHVVKKHPVSNKDMESSDSQNQTL